MNTQHVYPIHRIHDAYCAVAPLDPTDAVKALNQMAASTRSFAPFITLPEALLLSGAVCECPMPDSYGVSAAAYLAQSVERYSASIGGVSTGLTSTAFIQWLRVVPNSMAEALMSQAACFCVARIVAKAGTASVEVNDFFVLRQSGTREFVLPFHDPLANNSVEAAS